MIFSEFLWIAFYIFHFHSSHFQHNDYGACENGFSAFIDNVRSTHFTIFRLFIFLFSISFWLGCRGGASGPAVCSVGSLIFPICNCNFSLTFYREYLRFSVFFFFYISNCWFCLISSIRIHWLRWVSRLRWSLDNGSE